MSGPGAVQKSALRVAGVIGIELRIVTYDHHAVARDRAVEFKVVTPSARVRAKPARVFSGHRPRAPRWPCRSNVPLASGCQLRHGLAKLRE